MTRRIFRGIFIVSIIAVITAASMVLGVTYTKEKKLYTSQIEEETELLCAVMRYTTPDYDVERLSELSGFENRVTYIAADGTVLFDNKADPAGMENHADRDEVKAALQNGTGSAVRDSQTLSEYTIYCAKALPDGCVIRVSGTRDTVFSALFDMWWEILVALVIAGVISLVLAVATARGIVKPINAIDLDAPDIPESYGEIAPLLHCIKDRNAEIERQMSELSRSRREFSLITENMSEGFVIIDSRAEVLSYNKAAVNILGEEPDAESRTVLRLNRGEGFRTLVQTALSGKRGEVDLSVSGRVYRVIATPVLSEGKTSGAVMIILDVTEKESREELRREFTSNVSHELKTPLTTIYGISDMLAGGIVKPEDVCGFAGNIREETGRLIGLIEDIIKLSQFDENSFADSRENVDIAALALSCAKRLARAAEKKRVSINVSGSAEYTGIRSVLEEMIYNLIDNAVKYNRQGGSVNVDVSDGESTLTITVSDTGIGIPAGCLDRVFERFYRVDKSRSRKIGGTGLGLSIVKHGAALHGGTVDIKSTEGQGTTVTICCPENAPDVL